MSGEHPNELEVEANIRILNTRNAADPDEPPTGHFRLDEETFTEALASAFCDVQYEERTPLS